MTISTHRHSYDVLYFYALSMSLVYVLLAISVTGVQLVIQYFTVDHAIGNDLAR